MPRRARRLMLFAAAGLVAWYVCVLLLWAVQPLSDSVPIGIDLSLKQPKQVSKVVDCNSLFAGSARDSGPLPALNVQPIDADPLTYSRTACTTVQRDARIIFSLNTLFVMFALAGMAYIARRLAGQPDLPPLPASATRPSPA